MTAVAEKSAMEKIVCHSERVTKGFEFCWTIDHLPTILKAKILKSPVFEALSHHWTLQLEFESTETKRLTEKVLYIRLILVDNKGNKLLVIPNEPFFGSSELVAKVSFLDEQHGILSSPLQLPYGGKSLKTILLGAWTMGGQIVFNEERSLSGKTVNKRFESKLWGIINGLDEFKRIQMVFELRVVLEKIEKVVAKNRPLSAIKNSIDGKKLFEEGKFSDFVIRTGDGGEIRAHRNILNNSSRYFEAMFDLGDVEVQRGELAVPESHSVMNAIIRFLYTGEPPKENEVNVGAVEMYIAADKYQVDGLKGHFESAFEKAVNELFTVENVCAELVRAHIGGVQCMKAKAAEFIRSHRNWVMKTEGWTELCRLPALVAYLFGNN